MPTREQIEAAIADVERTLSEYPGQRVIQFAQMQDHEWPGFSRDEQRMVIGRVLDFEPKDQWMTGLDREMSIQEIESTRGWNRSMELEAYLDNAPEREIDDWYDWVERQDASDSEGHVSDPVLPPIRPLTEQLIDASILDIWPSRAAIVDFGIDSEQHLGALQFAIRNDMVTPQELDAAMGDGAKLTEIAQRGDNPYHDVNFQTSWDRMSPEATDEPKWYDTKAILAELLADQNAARGITKPEVKQERVLDKDDGREM